jgi:hypothetical protein
MKNIVLLATLIAFVHTGFSQKKLVPVSTSELTGISLPANTKKDTRGLSVSVAKMLLEIPITKKGTTLSEPEVLVIPSFTVSGFTEDSLIQRLTLQGWKYTKHPTDKNYAWINKANQNLISYYSSSKSEHSLYFCRCQTRSAGLSPG